MSAESIPFLRPNLPPVESWIHRLHEIDRTRLYSNGGPFVREFERRILDEVFGGEGDFATVSNGTTGLMLAIRGTARAGRYAVMPSFTFAATPLAAAWAGFEPWFVDVAPEDWCADADAVRAVVDRLGDEVAVVVPYATFGTAMPLDGWAALQERGVPVVVDAAASFGTTVEGRAWGRGFAGTIVYSFHATKSFAVGEAGGVYSGDGDRIERIRRATNFAFGPERAALEIGMNAKISEYTAAIALSTLDAFPQKAAARRRRHRLYLEALRSEGLLDLGWRVQNMRGEVPLQCMSVLPPPGTPRESVRARLAEAGIESRHYFSPACHEQPAFAEAPSEPLPVTHDLAGRIVNLPLWETLAEPEIRRIVEALR